MKEFGKKERRIFRETYEISILIAYYNNMESNLINNEK